MIEYRQLCIKEAERIAFHHKLGRVPVVEPGQKLIDEDPNDIQLEYDIQMTLELEDSV